MTISLLAKLSLIESGHWVGLGTEFLTKTAAEARTAIAAYQASAASGSPTFPESQGPELTREQIEANWKTMQPTWQPILDSLTGKAP